MKAARGHGPYARLIAAKPGEVLWFDGDAFIKTYAYRAGKKVKVEWCWAVGIRSGTTSKVVRVTVLA